MARTWPCEVCDHPVKLTAKRYREVALFLHTVRCEQCRRFVSPGSARVSQLPSEQVVPSLGLAAKQGKRAKIKRGLASLPLKRLGATACEAGGAVGE